MSTVKHYLSDRWDYRGQARNHTEQSEFRREFWNYISLRSRKYRGQTSTVENMKRSQWFATGNRAPSGAIDAA